MKFEAGLEKKARDEQKANGEKLKGMDAYKDFNSEEAVDLLEKRKAEEVEFEEIRKERLKKLEELEKSGTLFVHE